MLTYAEIATATAELEFDESAVEELHGFLERAEIEVVEATDPALAATEPERAPVKRGRRGRRVPSDLKPETTTDALQLFFKGIGKVRLLTAPEEVELAEADRAGRG